MKIALIGYGKMGKEIEKIALERGHEISVIVNSQHPIETVDLSQTDVCIEFSAPQMALKHIQSILHAQKPVVVGTTGWNEHLDEVSDWVKSENGSLVYASNFSVGVNIFFKLNEYLAKLMANYPEYKAEMVETHHTQKKDYPSGTALSLAQGIIDNNLAYNNWNAALNEDPQKVVNTLPIRSNRIENVPGTHEIDYISEIDSIKIEHKANNRKGFALGAVIAAEWIVNQKGIFTFKDVLNF